ncbi:putative ATP synthase subunit f, mitochondrial [Mya arenaria]|uniref:putative ATP synthase subunit f, mitochondrial n=1 Tax=Mya arenaria TaxID=6604 RepID=UPI0022E689C3|nr:putative ATP synthase subunit f, mitochondrial [Mya arenaria]XP_052791139.1 putative ATP synthase subunit f, mitochondrial [Mya arenaria]
MSESAVKLVTNAEQHARGGPRVILPKVNWPYYGDVYNPKIHGTYDPSIKYGPAKPSIWTWKIKDIPSQLKNADKTSPNVMNTMSRWYYRVTKTHLRCTRTPIRPYIMAVAVVTAIQFGLKLGVNNKVQPWKYHW